MWIVSTLRNLTVVLVLIFLASRLQAESPRNQSSDRDVIQRIRQAVEYEVEAKKLPAFSIALVRGDSILWSAGFGYEDVEKKRPATAQTIYRVGSVSKLFTDLAVMREVEQGRVALDAPITKILPDFHPHNPFDQPITLGQLMSHRSGLVREPPVGHYFDPTQPTLEATITSLNETTLVYPPGSRTKYSNAGVSVVGYALSRMRGEPFESLIERTLLQPMELTATSFRLTPKLKPRAAVGWMWTYDGRRFTAPTFPLGTGPAGNLYSSVEDLARFWTILFRGGKTKRGHVVVRPETLEAMWTPQRDAQGRPTSFGIGFHVQKLDGHRKVGHGGAIYGFATQLEGLPDEKLGVAAVAALDGANGVVTRLCDYALKLLLAQRAGKPLPDYERTKPVPRTLARKLAGTYTDGERHVWLRELGGTLTLRSGVTETTVRQRADGSLVVDSPLGFGTPVKLENSTLHVGSHRYQRIDDGPPPPAPQRWQGLIGEYGWDHNTLYILEDGGQLYALIEWFFYYPLKELSPTEFAFPDYGLYHGEKIVFRLGEDGRATEAVAAGIQFARRNVGTRSGETFRIEPVRPVEELRKEAQRAQPPKEKGDFLPADWVELVKLDPTIRLDIRYATTNNFMGAVFYQEPRAFMQRPAAEALVRAHRRLRSQGLGLWIFDAYRPWYVTKMFWDATPQSMKTFVADPSKGSRHNRGCAVDLTLYDLRTGRPVEMVSGYDEFSPRAFPAYPGGTSRQRWYRDLLRRTMEAEGFEVYTWEWWHFDYHLWKRYRIHNRPLSD